MKERSKSSKVMFLCFMIMCFGMGMWNSVIHAEAYDGVSGFYQWEYNDNGKGITITNYTGGEINITMPSKISGKPVTVIGREAFYDNDWMESIKIPSTVKEILVGAFLDCDELKSINIPDSVINIESSYSNGERTFGDCDNLTSVIIGNNVQQIPDSCFSGCKNLESVIIGSKVGGLNNSAFENCVNLKSIKIPGSVKYIWRGVFENCSKLESVELSYGLEMIGEGAFLSCSSLKSIIIPNSVKSIKSTYSNGERTFGDCDNLTSVIIGNNVQKIPDSCFSGSKNLESVIIGNKVVGIDDSAFENCVSLKSIKIPSSVNYISTHAFINCSKLERVDFSYGLETIGEGAFFACSSLKNITIPNSVKSIKSTYSSGRHTFGNCDDLATVFIPNSVTYIGEYCFDNRTEIKGYANSVAERYATENGLSFSTMPSVYAASVKFNEKKIVMYTDQVKYVSYTLLPSNTTDAIEWASSNTSILEVNHLGQLTAKAPGSVSLMAQTTSGKRASITVIISNPPKSLAFKTKTRTLMSGQSYTQYALVDGGSRKDVVVSYTSSDPSIAFVDSKGKVTAKKGGTATITAKTFNGLKDTYKVTVRALPTYIKLNKSSLTLGIKETYKLKTSTPANSYVSKITFKSNHSNIATVDASGRVKAIKYGKAIITVKTNNGKTASCTVNVRKAPSKLKFNKAKLTLKPGRAYTLKLVYSNGTYSYSKKFTTSNSRVAVVNSSGKITAKKKGKATIKVRTFNGKQASCVVTVK